MESSPQHITISDEDLHLESLPDATQEAFLEARTFAFLSELQWYLAGGTALALQEGHRESVDLGFFTQEKAFSIEKLESQISKKTEWTSTLSETGTLYGVINDAKVGFISYPFFTPSKLLDSESIAIPHRDDIAVMKIIAISQRGTKRDFIDLYWYTTHHKPLLEILEQVPRQYAEIQHNETHLIKSLVYFEDAEDDPEPKLFFDADWDTVKSHFKAEVPKVTKELLGI